MFKSVDGVLQSIDGETILQFPNGKEGDYVIPEGVELIKGDVFYGKKLLNSVTISSTVRKIDNKAFSGCSSLTSIYVNESNEVFKSIDGILFDNNNSLLEYPEGREGKCNIPVGTTSITNNAFKECHKLTGVNIPGTVVVIERNAFEGCDGLTELNIENGVKTLESYSFSSCIKLKSVIIPSSVTTIDEEAFGGCKSLQVVSYLGMYDPGTYGPFRDCDSIHHICVPLNYDDFLFCSRQDYCKTDSCDSLVFISTKCYEESCIFGEKAMVERKNITEWEKRSDACLEFTCDDSIGPIVHPVCKSTEEIKYICSNDGCLKRNQTYSVEIDFDNLFAGDVSLNDISIEIKTLTGISVDVGLEINDDAYVVHVVVLIEDEESGQTIVDSVNNMKKDENCRYRILCRTKTARLIVISSLDLSDSRTKHETMFTMVMLMIVHCLIKIYFKW